MAPITSNLAPSVSSSERGLETALHNVNLHNGCETLSDTSTISELWRIHPSSVIPPQTVDELLDVHSTFSRIERVYLSSLELLHEVPNHLTANEHEVLFELEVRSSADLTSVWDQVNRIATVSMLAWIVRALPVQDPIQRIAHASSYFQAIAPLQLQFIEDPQLSEHAHHHAMVKHQVLTELVTALQADASIPSMESIDELDVRVTGIANLLIGSINHNMVAYIAERVVDIFAPLD